MIGRDLASLSFWLIEPRTPRAIDSFVDQNNRDADNPEPQDQEVVVADIVSAGLDQSESLPATTPKN